MKIWHVTTFSNERVKRAMVNQVGGMKEIDSAMVEINFHLRFNTVIVHVTVERVDLKGERGGRPSAGSFDAF